MALHSRVASTRTVCSGAEVVEPSRAVANQKGKRMIDPAEIDNRFTYHPPNDGQVLSFTAIRVTAKQFAHIINAQCPDGREKSLALTKLEEAVMHANSAIARRSGDGVTDA